MLKYIRIGFQAAQDRNGPPFPRKRHRGLGMVDSLLAIVVLTFLGIIFSNISTAWMEQQVSQAEARALSAHADEATAHLLENRDLFKTATETPQLFTLSNRLGIVSPDKTPWRRRDIAFWYWALPRQPDRLILAVIASGDLDQPAPLPAPGDGITMVGAMPMDPADTTLIGPGIRYHDIGALIRRAPGLAHPGDMIALRDVSLTTTADPYLHRTPVKGRPALNRMSADLDMGGHNILNAEIVTTDEVKVRKITSSAGVTIVGSLKITGQLTTTDAVHVGSAAITKGAIIAQKGTFEDLSAKNGIIQTLNVKEGCTGCNPAP